MSYKKTNRLRYNGEEEYTEKVDTFSFGMFVYELLTLRQPFAGFETVKELILEGGRPPLTFRQGCSSRVRVLRNI